MATFYVDTSALVKVYVAETGHGWMRALCLPRTGNAISTSQLASIEVEVALYRKAQERSINEADRDKCVTAFRRHILKRYSVVPISDDVCRGARRYVHVAGLPHPLRTYDALHLASAQIISDTLATLGTPSLIFVAADRRLIAIAQYLGFATDNPEDHP